MLNDKHQKTLYELLVVVDQMLAEEVDYQLGRVCVTREFEEFFRREMAESRQRFFSDEIPSVLVKGLSGMEVSREMFRLTHNAVKRAIEASRPVARQLVNHVVTLDRSRGYGACVTLKRRSGVWLKGLYHDIEFNDAVGLKGFEPIIHLMFKVEFLYFQKYLYDKVFNPIMGESQIKKKFRLASNHYDWVFYCDGICFMTIRSVIDRIIGRVSFSCELYDHDPDRKDMYLFDME